MTVGIYTITNTQSGKVYVGKSLLVERRWQRHRSFLRRGRHENKHLQRAWAKYGEDVFVFDLVEVVTPDLILSAEERWASRFPPDQLYNQVPVGSVAFTGQTHSQEYKDRVRLARGRPVTFSRGGIQFTALSIKDAAFVIGCVPGQIHNTMQAAGRVRKPVIVRGWRLESIGESAMPNR